MLEPNLGGETKYGQTGNRIMERGQTQLAVNKTGQIRPAPEGPPLESRAATVQGRPGEAA